MEMLARPLRRGVSLEVIVEEDDQAQVTLDAVPQDDDSDWASSPTSSSTDASSSHATIRTHRRSDGRDLGCRRDRRRRKRREGRPWVLDDRNDEEECLANGLCGRRQRSLSCETLTILDIGEDESSREDWEEEARQWESSEGSDSGWSGIGSCISRRKILAERTKQENVTEATTETVLPDENSQIKEIALKNVETTQNATCQPNDSELVEENKDCTSEPKIVNINESCTFEKKKLNNEPDLNTWIAVGDLENENDNSEFSLKSDSPTSESLSRTGTLEKEVRFRDEPDFVTETPLANERSLVEQEHLVDVRTGRDMFETMDKSGMYTQPLQTVISPEVSIVENQQDLDRGNPFHTEPSFLEVSPSVCRGRIVSAVRQFFENDVGITSQERRQHFEDKLSHIIPNRFDHVRCNPSSKILRFERDRHSSTLPRKPSSPQPKNSTPFKSKQIQSGNTVIASTGVHLRKPTVVRGFDIRKALRENPRYFHIRVHKAPLKCTNSSGPQKNDSSLQRVTYSYVEAKRVTHPGATTTLRWTNGSFDRCSEDADSLSSDSSEDSGVARDFASSAILRAFANDSKAKRHQNTRTARPKSPQDDSFKWIDPSILSKIRSMGTTVIYFGPRKTKGRNKEANALVLEKKQPVSDYFSNKTDYEVVNTSPAKIIGETRKTGFLKSSKNTNYEPIKSLSNDRDSISSDESEHLSSGERTPHNTDEIKKDFIRPFPHRDSISLINSRDCRKNSAGNLSVIYDFTQQKQQL